MLLASDYYAIAYETKFHEKQIANTPFHDILSIWSIIYFNEI